MWYFTCFTAGFITSTALLAWFLHAVDRSKHTEDEKPATIPATIQVRKYPHYTTYTNSVDPVNNDPDIIIHRTCTYRHANQSDLPAAETNVLSAADLSRLAHMRREMEMSEHGRYSED